MNKRELVARMTHLSKLNKEDCSDALNAFMAIVKECYHNDEQLALTRFGTFLPFQRKARIGVSPVTKQKMTIPASKRLKFRASKFI